jgi:hypothetical protein
MSVAPKRKLNLCKIVNPMAFHKLAEYGLEHYCAARLAAWAKVPFAAAPQYHHAVEYLLKCHFSRTRPTHDLREQCGHKLRALWQDFKTAFPQDDLSPFDAVVGQLDDFETIRYPDDLEEYGGAITLAWDGPGATDLGGAASDVPRYCLNVRNLDKLVARIVLLIGINPSAFTHKVLPEAREIILSDNPEVKGWFSRR